ncbi:sulfite exporter TauE/SafE family protein [Actinotalea sp. Marseille-Q4924]|uniref:urease accessory protein UreH domain-containing protein n=1 Tax=Actinotalea sp. Marseille-Q4924 TaxID=2866571 RepID=UPI001CE3B80A|nr:sulfite exporter TauE/SafE family protein [Actinotalea sp. Marseille-Q4924]
MPATVELPVQGMTCTACERRIAKALTKVHGVSDARVSVRRGRATVRTTGRVPRSALVRAVRAAGYEVGEDASAWFSRDRTVWRDLAVAVAVLVVLGLALEASGLTGLADRVGGLASSGSLALVVVLGLAAGFSTCMALVGGLVLAVSARHAEQHPGGSTRQRMRPHVAFNLGRVAGFAVLGGLTGALGSALSLSGHMVAVLMVAVSVVMVGLGVRLTGLSPRLSRSTAVTLPTGLSQGLGLESTGSSYSDRRAALLGAGTFLLPCGFTQAVQVYALSTGDPLQASAIMTLFAVGTMPGLLGVGGLAALARGASATRFFRFAGVAVLAFAAVNVSGALGILAPGLVAPATAASGGAGSGSSAAGPGAVSENVTLTEDLQTVRTTQVAAGYEPYEAVVVAGVPIRWEIDSVAVSCAASLWAPDLGIEPQVLRPGVNVVELVLDEPGTYAYSCGMGMYWGAITVVEAEAAGVGAAG